jgi:hypothetical protein
MEVARVTAWLLPKVIFSDRHLADKSFQSSVFKIREVSAIFLIPLQLSYHLRHKLDPITLFRLLAIVLTSYRFNLHPDPSQTPVA